MRVVIDYHKHPDDGGEQVIFNVDTGDRVEPSQLVRKKIASVRMNTLDQLVLEIEER